MSEIRIENLTKSYQEAIAVDHLSLVVRSGEFAAMLGPSGCGKTSLLRCIAGLERPDDGEIYIDGELVNDSEPRQRDLSMVFQSFALFDHMTVYDNVAFPLKVRGKSSRDINEQVRRTAHLLGIQNLLEKKPRQLSGGEQQRVAIARAVIRQPRAFLMDEPLSSLDAPLRVRLRTELKKIQKELGITSIYVTHDQSEAMALASRIGVMNSGRLLQYDEPEIVYRNPASLFVASFVGNPPSNLIEASFRQEGTNATLLGAGLTLRLNDQSEATKAGGGGLILSVRPEDVRVSVSESGDSAGGEVSLLEPLGAQTLMSVNVGGTTVRALVAPDFGARVGQRVWLSIVDGRAHVYAKDSGLLLL